MRFDPHQDYSTDVGIRGFGATRAGAFEQRSALALTAIVGRVAPSRPLICIKDDRFMRRKQVGLTRTNHPLVRSGFTNSRKSGSPQRDNTA